MKSRIYISALFVLFSNLYMAQVPFGNSPEFGNYMRVGAGKNLYPVIVGSNESTLYAVSYGLASISIHQFNKETLSKEVAPINLKLAYQNNKLNLEDAFMFNNKLVFLTSYRNKEKDVKFYFLQTYTGEGQLSDPNLVAQIDWTKSSGGLSLSKNRFEQLSALKLDISQNGEYLSIVSPGAINREEVSNKTWHALVLDQNLKEVWRNKFDLESVDFHINNAKVNNKGVVYCSSALNDRKRNLWSSAGAQNMYYDFYHVNFLNFLYGDNHSLEVVYSDKHEHKDLNLEGSKFISMSMDVIDDEVVFYGITENGESLEYQAFFAVYDGLGNSKATNFVDLDASMFTSSRIRKGLFRKGAEKDVRYYYLNDLHKNATGDFVFIAEEFRMYIERRTTNAGYAGSTMEEYYHYQYGNLLMFSFSGNGDVKWVNSYPKFHATVNDNGYMGSYFSMIDGNDLYVLTNTRERYLQDDDDDDESKSIGKGKVIVAWVKIDESGKITDDILIGHDIIKGHRICLRYGELNKNEFIATSHFYPGLLSTAKLEVISIPYNK